MSLENTPLREAMLFLALNCHNIVLDYPRLLLEFRA